MCSNDFLDYLQLKTVLTMLRVFIWIIGLATLVAGVVGVSNIMLISVKERTRELGVRKAMGATDSHIITLVLLESVAVSLIFGYVGMILGVGLTQLPGMDTCDGRWRWLLRQPHSGLFHRNGGKPHHGCSWACGGICSGAQCGAHKAC